MAEYNLRFIQLLRFIQHYDLSENRSRDAQVNLKVSFHYRDHYYANVSIDDKTSFSIHNFLFPLLLHSKKEKKTALNHLSCSL